MLTSINNQAMKYIIVFLLTIILSGTIGTSIYIYFEHKKYIKLEEQYDDLSKRYTALETNNTSLKSSIDRQNLEISQYKADNEEFINIIDELNKNNSNKINELNKIIHNYEKANTEDAEGLMIWLKEKALQF